VVNVWEGLLFRVAGALRSASGLTKKVVEGDQVLHLSASWAKMGLAKIKAVRTWEGSFGIYVRYKTVCKILSL
jgi:hypothetical protein